MLRGSTARLSSAKSELAEVFVRNPRACHREERSDDAISNTHTMPGDSILTFQEAVFALEQFWASQGCLIWHPYYLQVGAGTMNPATFLRVLGPEPWRVAYVEPSVRPDDARYGENPNRMGLHYQYQVILKPDPGNPQELYLESLAALGIDPRQHDIRFVEDNWEQPALGAWGLGWEVWLDGLEITQFTYFQQAGGQALEPVSVEITYGLERILMALQGADHFVDIQWDAQRTYGDLNLAAEQQHSQYYFEGAEVELLRQMFDGFEAEAQRALQAGLVFPAYDYLLRCSHTFNVLDTRGSIGVTERASYFAKMREIARAVAEAYLEGREEEGFPWLENGADKGATSTPNTSTDTSSGSPTGPKVPSTLLLEIGTEELPAGDLTAAIEQLEAATPSVLEQLRLEHRLVSVNGTPRRLVVEVQELAPRQSDVERIAKGPPWDVAFDEHGQPTDPAKGFASSSGVAVEDLKRAEMDGGTYATAQVREQGRPAWEVLGEALPDLVADLRFDRAMRWNATGAAFSRPIRWLLALHGREIIPFEYAGLRSGRTTRGLRRLESSEIEARDSAKYLKALAEREIILDSTRRRTLISKQVQDLAEEVSGQASHGSDLIEEVTNLVEAPESMRGSFDEAHLALPSEVLISVMEKHQRYFPVEANGKLLPYFIVVGNGIDGSEELVVRGNEHVVHARFADAAYFVERDLEQPLEDYVEALARLSFQADLGSMLDKTVRLESVTAVLADHLDLGAADRDAAVRAARLCKADLATRMVIDMTSLQGAMGRYYAAESGEPEIVSDAIYEHYLPRSAGDQLPQSTPGTVLGLADRLDSLIGLFSVGVRPTGTRDPFGLRRSARGLIQILVGKDMSLDLRLALGWAWDGLGRSGAAESLEDCLAFIVRRQQRMLREAGRPHDVVDAVLSEQGEDPAHAAQAVDELAGWTRKDDWLKTLQAYSRCARITRDLEATLTFDQNAVVEDATRNLFDALQTAEAEAREPGSVNGFVNVFQPMIPAIERFFDDVLVMTEEQNLQDNRLALLQRVVALAKGVADLSKLEGF